MKNLFKIIVLLGFLSPSLYAGKEKKCSFSVNPSDIKVTWTAFKTPQKVGVKGTFTDLGIKGPSNGSSLNEIIRGSTFLIRTETVDTQDKARDVKIAQFFFKKVQGDSSISGKVQSMDDKLINLEITMNGKVVLVPLAYQIKGSRLSAAGSLDILDFAMEESLKSINMACSEKHEKKTWSDVNLLLEATFNKSCK